MGFIFNAIFLIIVAIILIIILPVPVLHELGTWMGQLLSFVANAVGNKLSAVNTYNAYDTSSSTLAKNSIKGG